MKVLHVVKTSEGATWAYRQIKVLVEQGVDIHVVVPTLKGNFPELLNNINVPVYVVNFNERNPIKLIKEMKKMKSIIENIQPDIVHSHFVLTTYLLRILLRNSKIPRIFQVPGPLHLEKGPFGFIDKVLSRTNDYWIATCKLTLSKYESLGIKNDKVFVSYYGTDVERFLENQERSNKIRKELGVNGDVPLIAMVAYMYPPKRYLGQRVGLKGHEDFIEAIAKVKKVVPNIKAIIVGKSWGKSEKYEEHLKKMAQEKCGDSIIFLGFRNDIPEIYNNINIAVHPSHSENLGGAAESILAGVPTISTDVGGFPDIVIEGETGWLVPYKRPDKLANKIINVLNNENSALTIARHGKEMLTEILDVKNTGVQTYQIYLEILQRNKA